MTYLYYSDKLKDDLALLWLFVSISVIALSLWQDLRITISRLAGAESTADFITASYIAFLLMICIYFSVKISALTEQNKLLAQEVAILRGLLSKMKGNNESARH